MATTIVQKFNGNVEVVGVVSGNGSGLTALNGSQVTTGTVAEARIADLDGSKITTGTVAQARIADLDGSKITTGTIVRPVNATTVQGGSLTTNDYIYHAGNTTTSVRFPTSDTISLNTAGNERMRVSSTGNVGIGETNPGYKLHVGGAIYASGDITAFSDMRMKENIKPIENALERVKQIGGYTYNKVGESKTDIGVLAQEVMKVFPEVIHGSEDTNYSVAYGNMVGILIEAIKELSTQVSTLQNDPRLKK